jgi:hypothetical protein
MLGLPCLTQLLKVRFRFKKLVLAFIFFVFVSDNMMFITTQTGEGFTASADLRRLLDEAETQNLRGTVATVDADTGYAVAVYSYLDPVLGQRWYTTDFSKKRKDVEDWKTADSAPDWAKNAKYLLLAPEQRKLGDNRKLILSHAGWALYQ